MLRTMDLHPNEIGSSQEPLEPFRRCRKVVQQGLGRRECDAESEILRPERDLVEQKSGILRGPEFEFQEQTFHGLTMSGMDPEAGLDRDEL